MQLIHTRPFKPVQEVEALFDALLRPGAHRFGWRSEAWTPRVDIIESDAALTLRWELAGFRLEDLEVTLDDGVLTVKGSRSTEAPDGAVHRRRELAEGEFSRSIRVADHFDPDRVEASLANGILEVVLEKAPEVHPRTIEIKPA